MDAICERVAREMNLPAWAVENTARLLDEGNTIPFIARYRKEQHGALDDQTLRALSDLQPGMLLTGTVRNVCDFGAFVDIGVHQDGLVHISQLSDRYVRHPSEVVQVGDIVKTVVLSVNPEKKRISLSMKQPGKQ